MKIFCKSSLYIFLLVVLSAAVIFPGQTGKIAGTVKDKSTGEPLIGVNIFIEKTTIGAASDINGDYFIVNIPPGEYTVVASMIGYQSMKVTKVIVTADKTTNINFELEVQRLELNEEVVVTAERLIIRKDLTSSELSVTSSEIKSLPVESLSDILQLKAGVVTDAGGGIHIRGGRTSEVSYLIDGIPVNDNYSGSSGASVDIQFMEEVKVISGVFNAEYGQALSGVVDVITKQGSNTFQANISVSSGDYLSNNKDIFFNIDEFNPTGTSEIKANISGPLNVLGKNFSYNLAFRRFSNDGYLYGQKRFNPKDSSFQEGDAFYIVSTGDNKIISINPFLNYNFQGKFTLNLLQELKISNLFLWDKTDSKYYNHIYKLNPDGLPEKFTNSINNIITFTYVFSPSTFLDLKYSYGRSEEKSYVFEDIRDARYANPELLNQLTSYAFLTGGTDMGHSSRITNTNIIKADLFSQIDNYNGIKTGIELNIGKIQPNNEIVKYQDTLKVFDFNYFINQGNFEYNPLSFAYYLQDKVEYKSVIINAGVRYDYFNSNGKVPTDLRDPENSPKINAKEQHQVSPRLGIAFPISADGTIHFSYGHFFQLPPYSYLYSNPNYRVGPGGLYTLMGNANLKAQSIVAYELGLHYQFFDMIGLEVIGYYKDITNLLGTEIQDSYIKSDRYALYVNRDYGKARGFTVSITKRPTEDHVSVSLDYTLQIAEGNASDPNDAYDRAQGTPPKQPNIQVVPLNWDQRHTINLSLFYIVPGDFNLGVIAKYESGFPYTPELQSIQTSFENSARIPSKTNVDLQFNKDFMIGETALSFFVRVFNLFDTRNEINVYRDTGRAGYTLLSQYTPQYQGPNTLDEFLNRPDYYSEPRRILLGVSYNFNMQ
ncbi:MAG: TonB-dependent receptor [Ignavibacteriaceae bacterium]|nr:TonB-dependent receptor [Ignavibacteriaceae bacterium]